MWIHNAQCGRGEAKGQGGILHLSFFFCLDIKYEFYYTRFAIDVLNLRIAMKHMLVCLPKCIC